MLQLKGVQWASKGARKALKGNYDFFRLGVSRLLWYVANNIHNFKSRLKIKNILLINLMSTPVVKYSNFKELKQPLGLTKKDKLLIGNIVRIHTPIAIISTLINDADYRVDRRHCFFQNLVSFLQQA